ncbi:MAG: hypothetical protein AB7H48_10095 [Parachlamydiales bacterium]
MAASIYDFRADIKANWAWLVTSDKKGNPGKNFKIAASLASKIYENTIHADLPFILIGPDRIRNNANLASSFGLCTSKTAGSILGERQWSLLINDAFMMGGVHSRKDVLLFLKKDINRNIIWNDASCSLTSFGRELAILQFAGFHRGATLCEKEVIFHLPEGAPDPDHITLPLIWSHLKQIRDPETILAFVNESECMGTFS